MQSITIHGGDIDLILQNRDLKKENIVNFSGNVNPIGPSETVKNAIIKNIDKISQYPDVEYKNLRSSIGKYINVKSEYIIPGSGATELISIFIKAIKPKNTVIIAPAYSEYEKEVTMSGGNVFLFPLDEKLNFDLNLNKLFEFINNEIDLIILCNPNNPTGTAIGKYNAEKLLNFCSERNIYVMVDETYIEFTENSAEMSMTSIVNKFKNLFIVRGTAKFFACPGIRLGYGICSNTKLLSEIFRLKEPWSVNVFAEIAGNYIFDDNEYIEKTKMLINNERKKISVALSEINNIKFYPTLSNFFLIKILKSDITSAFLFEEFLKCGFVIRDASSFAFLNDRYIRFCIMMPEQNNKLINKLKEILK